MLYMLVSNSPQVISFKITHSGARRCNSLTLDLMWTPAWTCVRSAVNPLSEIQLEKFTDVLLVWQTVQTNHCDIQESFACVLDFVVRRSHLTDGPGWSYPTTRYCWPVFYRSSQRDIRNSSSVNIKGKLHFISTFIVRASVIRLIKCLTPKINHIICKLHSKHPSQVNGHLPGSTLTPYTCCSCALPVLL